MLQAPLGSNPTHHLLASYQVRLATQQFCKHKQQASHAEQGTTVVLCTSCGVLSRSMHSTI
jgi:hypothetical protein